MSFLEEVAKVLADAERAGALEPSLIITRKGNAQIVLDWVMEYHGIPRIKTQIVTLERPLEQGQESEEFEQSLLAQAAQLVGQILKRPDSQVS